MLTKVSKVKQVQVSWKKKRKLSRLRKAVFCQNTMFKTIFKRMFITYHNTSLSHDLARYNCWQKYSHTILSFMCANNIYSNILISFVNIITGCYRFQNKKFLLYLDNNTCRENSCSYNFSAPIFLNMMVICKIEWSKSKILRKCEGWQKLTEKIDAKFEIERHSNDTQTLKVSFSIISNLT